MSPRSGSTLPTLIEQKKLLIDHVYLDRSLIEETGEYDLEALFVRLGHAVDSIGAKTGTPRQRRSALRRTRQ